ncbi:MAG: DegT/DnrJ/EryC1/StrS family aminotransferase [Sphaerochaetaceae bacterium]|jgi:L-glutamine:2-deoxy-scyllo-inosose/3-amino-2,3-dideoxy-scyllo-inosose aminotransferase|nr:DegT/DnrJ/EryC1/StrS family aminotransferase [Sphaerochaetaceae bacterium]MDX9809546.1 DegT/DnrJ/EryC1/StrS family aminotransferase [Sphaerochaetaceae bacterium]NLV84120.1 DegT/DnrJ/EryC1/StrS family aminotransferase [Spirochaetales bacterium]
MLAIHGGKPLRNVAAEPWPSWPVWNDVDRSRLVQVLDSGIWSYSGPAEQACLQWLDNYFAPCRSLLVANGTVSLQLALEALDIGYGDEVIVPGLTWQATAAAVVDVNAIPILVDVKSDTWCLDPELCEAAITEKTKAIIVVHLYGCTTDMDAIMDIAKRHHLYVIEDAAHKHGGQWRNQKAGTIGDIGSFSLQLSKVLTCGEGGILLTKEDRLWERLESLRNCGRRSRNAIFDATGGQYGQEGNFIQSGNYRLSDFQSAVLLGQCERLDMQNEIRAQNAAYLDELLRTCPAITPMRTDIRETKKVYFNYSFNYNPDELGIPTDTFRKALSAELGFKVEPSNQPLNDCSLYRPLTKRRYAISKEYLAQIDPARFSLPVCHDIFKRTSVMFHHKILLAGPADMEIISEACKKIAAHKDEFRH